VEIAGDLEYEVKEILDSRIVRGKLKYLVDWDGYGPDERSWEPVDHVQNAADAVESFHQRYPNRPSLVDIRQPAARSSQERGRRGELLS
jgi:Chromo (CHRromatin Organisation MOdifier) domain